MDGWMDRFRALEENYTAHTQHTAHTHKPLGPLLTQKLSEMASNGFQINIIFVGILLFVLWTFVVVVCSIGSLQILMRKIETILVKVHFERD